MKHAAWFTSIALIFLIATQVASTAAASSQTVSGQFQLSFNTADGNSAFTIFYTYPSSATIGQNFTLSFYVYVDTLTGLAVYLQNYGLVLTLSIGANQPLAKSVRVDGLTNGTFLYEGARWGPVNMTIPMTTSILGSTPNGGNASLSLSFDTDVWYVYQGTGASYPESGQKLIGSVQIQAPTQSSSFPLLIPVLIVVIAIAIVGLALALRRKKTPRNL